MMFHVTLHGVAGGVMLLLAAAPAAEAQDPHSASQTSVVQRLTDGSATTAVSGRIRELKCRGKPGIDLRVHQEQVPERSAFVTMVLRYERPKETRAVGQEGMGLVDYGRSVQFHPGSCTWNSGGFSDIPAEPGVVYFDLPRDAQTHAAPGGRDTTIAAAAHYPDVVSLPLYLSDSNRYWVFYVDDVSNVSISYGSWPLGGAAPQTSSVAGSLRDASPGSATLSSARVLQPDGSIRTTTVVPTPAPAPSPNGSAGGALRDKPPATVAATGARALPTDSAARRMAAVRTPAPTATGGVEGPLRDTSPGIATTPGDRALPTDTAARRTATVRTPTPTPTGTGAGPLRGTSPGTVTPSTSRVMPTDTAPKVPDDARAKTPQLRANRVYDVRTTPGPNGVRLTFKATGAGGVADMLGVGVYIQTGGIQVQFSRTQPSWDQRERRWFYPAGWNSPWFAEVHLAEGGGFVAEPDGKLTNGERYYYLITVLGDASSPPGQRTGSFTADIRTPLNGLFSK